MARTYSYDPANIPENGIDRMRLELGDTTFAPGELTAALCDEEYKSIIETSKSWNKAKLRCLDAILMRFAHQVNVSVDGVSYSFAQRVDFWKKLKDDLKKETKVTVPSVNPSALNGSLGGSPYFYEDLHTNRRKRTSGNGSWG